MSNIDIDHDIILHGRWLVVARSIWLALVGLVLSLYVGGFSTRMAYLPVLAVPPDDYLLRSDTATALVSMGISHYWYAISVFSVELILALSCLIIGIIIFVRQSRQGAAISLSLLIICLGCSESSFTGTLAQANPVWHLARNILQAAGIALALIVFYIFPDGRFVPRWTRFATLLYVALLVVWLRYPGALLNPLPDSTVSGMAIESVLFLFAWIGTGVYALLYRYRQTTTVIRRQQMKWVVYGLMLGFVAATTRYGMEAILRSFPPSNVHITALYDVTYRQIYWLILAIIPYFFANAIFRYKLWSIDLIINQTLVYGLLSLSVIVLYSTIVALTSTLFWVQNNWVWSMVTIGIIAAFFQPLRHQLQQNIDALFHRDPNVSIRLLDDLSQQVETSLAPDVLAQTIVDGTGKALNLPYAEIALIVDGTPRTFATYGQQVQKTISIELIAHEQPIGKLILGLTNQRESLDDYERALLRPIVRHTAMALRAVHLAAELQNSRTQIFTDIENERGRLCTDLHDGPLHHISLLTGKIHEAYELLDRDIHRSKSLLTQVLEEAIEAKKYARDIIYGLRPPILDLGLNYVLIHLAEQHQRHDLAIVADVPTILPALHPAIEKAVYLITQEALTNIQRHAYAQSCHIELSVCEQLILQIADDGRGITADTQRGVGLRSMSERAKILGGTWIIESKSGCGTTIIVRLPLLAPDLVTSKERV